MEVSYIGNTEYLECKYHNTNCLEDKEHIILPALPPEELHPTSTLDHCACVQLIGILFVSLLNLITINVTHISMFRNYSFNFGRTS